MLLDNSVLLVVVLPDKKQSNQITTKMIRTKYTIFLVYELLITFLQETFLCNSLNNQDFNKKQLPRWIIYPLRK